MAAHQVAFQLWSFLALVLDALAIAGQAMVGRLLGAGRAAEARAVSRRLLEWGVVAGVAFAAVVALARPVLPGLFTDDPRVADLIAQVLWLVVLLQPVNAVVFVLDGVLIGAGDLRFLARAMLGALVVYAPVAWAVGSPRPVAPRPVGRRGPAHGRPPGRRGVALRRLRLGRHRPRPLTGAPPLR